MNAEAERLISRLGLAPLPHEGGFFARTWSSERRDGDRLLGNAISFLITGEDFSALHRLRTDEIWFYHAGDPAELTVLDPATGAGATHTLGPDVLGSHVPHVVVRGGTWQGARIGPSRARGWTLFSTTMTPGWLESEFELGRRDQLLAGFPAFSDTIRALTRQ